MDSVATLIEITAYDPVAAASKTLRVTNRNDPRATTWNDQTWKPILTKSPVIGLSVFDGSFTGFGEVTVDSFTLAVLETELDEIARYVWHGATVKVYAGDLQTENFNLLATVVGNGATRKGKQELAVALRTRDELMSRPVLYLSYAGTGDIEGTTDVKGVLKPFVVGNAKYCRPVLIDPVRQIYQVHGYGPVEEIYGAFEGGLAIGTGGVPAATYNGTYAEFRDAAVAQGQWIRHNDLGLFKLGSQPAFPVTAHVKGDTNGIAGGTTLTRAADIVKRLVTMNVAGVVVKNSSIAGLNAVAAQPLDQNFVDQITVGEAVAGCLRSVGAYWAWDELGEVILGRVRFGASSLTLSGLNDRLPNVISVNALPTSAPVWSLRLGAEACHFVHDASSVVQSLVDLQDQLDAFDTSKNRVFPPGTVPPVGAVDGDLWPDTSSIPLVLRRYNGATWVAAGSYGADINLDNLFDSGSATPNDPLTRSAILTALGIAMAIAGQGALATQNSVNWASQILGIPANLAALVGTENLNNDLILNRIFADDVLDIAEKQELIPVVANLEARHAFLKARAAAMGLSTTALDAAMTAFRDLLASYSPAWNILTADTDIFTPAFADANFPAGWSLNNVTTSTQGGYTRVTDNSATVTGEISRGLTQAAAANQYSFRVPIKKDAVGAATRHVNVLIFGVAPFKGATLQIDTSTGDFGFSGLDAADVLDSGDEWLVWGSFTTDPANTAVTLTLNPAHSTNLSGVANAAVTGSVDVRTNGMSLVLGDWKKLGRFMLDARQADYAAEAQKLARDISDRDGTTGLVIQQQPDVTIYADSDGTIKPNELPRNVALKANVGLADVTTLGAWSRTVVNGITYTIGSATGVVNITALTVDEVELPISFLYNGVTRTTRVKVIRQKDLPSSGGGSGGGTSQQTDTLATANGSTYNGYVSERMTVRTGASGVLDFSAPLTFKRGGSTVGVTGAAAKWKWRAIGGSFASLTERTYDSPAESVDFGGNILQAPGSIPVNDQKTGLTPNTDYEVELEWRTIHVDGNAQGIYRVSGTMQVTGS